MYGALELAAEKLGKQPVEVLNEAMNVMPVLRLPRRVGGAAYQVPEGGANAVRLWPYGAGSIRQARGEKTR